MLFCFIILTIILDKNDSVTYNKHMVDKVRYIFTKLLLGEVKPDTTLNHVYILTYYLSTLYHVYYSQEK